MPRSTYARQARIPVNYKNAEAMTLGVTCPLPGFSVVYALCHRKARVVWVVVHESVSDDHRPHDQNAVQPRHSNASQPNHNQRAIPSCYLYGMNRSENTHQAHQNEACHEEHYGMGLEVAGESVRVPTILQLAHARLVSRQIGTRSVATCCRGTSLTPLVRSNNSQP